MCIPGTVYHLLFSIRVLFDFRTLSTPKGNRKGFTNVTLVVDSCGIADPYRIASTFNPKLRPYLTTRHYFAIDEPYTEPYTHPSTTLLRTIADLINTTIFHIQLINFQAGKEQSSAREENKKEREKKKRKERKNNPW